jgi:hypothetical protein
MNPPIDRAPEHMGTAQSKIQSPKSQPGWPTATPFRGSTLSLAAMLEAEFSGSQLRDLAKWLGVTPKGNSRLALLDQVIVALTTRTSRIQESPEALLEGLTGEQQDFTRRLLTARDHDLPIPRNVAAMVWARQLERDGDRRLTEIIESLRRRALLFPTHATFPGAFRDVYYQWLPLQGNVPVLKWDVRPDGSSAGGAITISGNFLEDFDAFLNAVMQTGITLRAALPMHKQAPRLIWLRDWEHDPDEAERVLRSRPNWVPDPQTGIGILMLSPFTPQSANLLENQTGLSTAHCEFLFALACALQMIEAPDFTPSLSPLPQHVRARNSAIEEWLVLTSEEKLRRAWRAWSEEIMPALEARSAALAQRPDESFRLVRAIGARDLTPGLFAAEWCALRRYMIRVLRGLPSGTWLRWADLIQRLHEFYPECAWTFTTRADWWFALASSGVRLNLARADEWHASLGRILEHIVRGPLTWFGAVEARLGADGAFEAFRITDMGAAFLGERAGALPADALPAQRALEPIAWLDKHTLRVPPAPDRAAFIGIVRQAAERGSEPFTYIFTPASIERALTQGVSMDDVAAQFKRMKVTLPKAISEQFRLIARRYGRIRVYQSLTILELGDDFAAKELAASTSLLKHVIYQLSPRAFVLPDEAVDQFIEELQSKGYTPRIK